MSLKLSRADIVARRDALPAFPRVIEEILKTADDPDASLHTLVGLLSRDPVLSARVFAQANLAANRTRRRSAVDDLFTAASLIGLQRLRRTTVTTCLAGFLQGALPRGLAPGYWQHSAACGLCAQQLGGHAGLSGDMALIAGLLHDVGQLWFMRFAPEAWMAAKADADKGGVGIEDAEKCHLGVDHSLVGSWLAESWGLPAEVAQAIRLHHRPEAAPDDLLVAVVHVAEVLSNALDLAGDRAQVAHLSPRCCELVGLNWGEECFPLFRRIEGHSRHLINFFQSEAV